MGRRHRHGPPPFGRGYMRAHLHRRMFGWFGLTILVTGLVFGAVMAVTSIANENAWHREMARIEAFASDRFAHVWDDPAARSELAQAVHQKLGVQLTLADASGKELGVFGERCRKGTFNVPVLQRGKYVGELFACRDFGPRTGPWRGLLALVLAGTVMWAATGKIARRISRPMTELARVAKELGDGNLKARVDVGPRADGEAVALGAAMNEMAARIERQIADQRELLAAVSHELRTPLGHMRLLIELARGGGDLKALDEIDKEVVEIDALVGQLLAKSKLEFRSLSPTFFNPEEVGRRGLERAGLEPALLQVAHVKGPLRQVHADLTLVQRAIANLLDNARKHAGGVAALRVREVTGTPGAVCFEVDDRGPGFTPGEEMKVFDAFYRSSQGPTRDPESVSLGLGLALVRRIAEAHGGRAWATNRPEGGATVAFEITSIDLKSSSAT